MSENKPAKNKGEKMKKCSNCGTEVPDNATSCPTCGEAIAQTSDAAAPKPEPAKKKKTGCIIAIAVVVFLVIVSAIGSCSNSCSKEAAKRSEDWPTSELAQMIPSMNKKCESVSETKDHLSITVSDNVSKNDFNSYVSKCEERGFDIDAADDERSYIAYNGEGYRLSVKFSDYSGDKIEIGLDTPKVNGELIWPTMGLATKIPNPGKSKGSIDIDSSSQFTAYIGEMSKEDFNAYIDKCIEMGFSVDHNKKDADFSAKNVQGDSLRLEYQGFSTMYISLSAARPATSSSSISSNIATSSSSSSTPTASSSDFKKTMDDYEKFIDGYIAFMEKYNSSGDPTSMMADYATMMADYSAMMSEIGAIDTTSLNASDYAYYTEVTTRVNNKLLAAAL